jgi:predicted MFS family arabinose efflux permease
MLTDILPEQKRAEGFGVMRVAANLAVAIGPAIGGFVAAYSYLVLFIADTISSLITAVIVLLVVEESRPQAAAEKQETNSLAETFAGYRKVLQDRRFMLFVVVSTIGTIVYMQMYSTLSVYLRDVHGVPEAGYGWLMTLNAGMVVIFQFLITRKVSRRPPMRVLAFGSLLYVVGFGMYGLVSAYLLFMAAMAVITLGEMIIVPVSQAFIGGAASEDMRGRYMGVAGLSWMIPGMIGPLLAGLIIDNANPDWVWYGCAILGTIAVIGFLWLQGSEQQRHDRVAETLLS